MTTHIITAAGDATAETKVDQYFRRTRVADPVVLVKLPYGAYARRKLNKTTDDRGWAYQVSKVQSPTAGKYFKRADGKWVIRVKV